jgi:hypothetical protein
MAQSANSYLQVSELDFEDIRSNLRSFLSTQTQFRDYNFDGSVMATLLDVLAYNTHYNAYYLNMVANEMFLDTAQQRDSVVSFAKELGYTPVSAIGAQAEITLTFTGIDSTIAQFTIPRNSKFSTTIDDIQYTYVTPRAETVIASDGVYSKTFTIKEGVPLTHRFTVNDANPVRYVLPNANVDTTSIRVSVQNSVSDTETTEFTLASNITQIYSTTPVYFLEEAYDGKYEIIFGQGSLGKKVINGNIIIVEYLVNNGDATNGATTFAVDTLTIEPEYTSVALTTVTNARGGRPQETIESIKFNAPRNYQTQNRAVINNDYQRILLAENPDLQSVIAFGGEQADPAVYGKVYIATKPFNEQFTTATRKQQLKESISDRTPLAVDPVIIDADYTYLIPTIQTNYDLTRTTDTTSEIEQAVRNAIASFSTNNLERFGNRLRYSRFVRALDNISSGSILNNNASIKLQKRFVPNLNAAELVRLKFNNPIRTLSVISTQFTFDGFASFLDDDGSGNIRIFRYSDTNQKVVINATAGTINYTTGEINVNEFLPTAYAGIEIQLTVTPENFDVVPVREQILIMNSGDAIITVVGESV